MIEAVIFDMDGLLVDSEPLWWRAFREVFKPLGIELSDDQLRYQAGRRINENIEELYHMYPWHGPSTGEVEEQVLDILIKYIEHDLVLQPGAKRTLEICAQTGLPIAIASSSAARVIDAVIKKFSLQDIFVHLYSGEHEPYGKPHPGIFITTASLLDVRAADCLVFEDSPAGVLAAKAAKMTCIAVPDPAHRQDKFIQTADLILDSLKEFTSKLLNKF